MTMVTVSGGFQDVTLNDIEWILLEIQILL